MANLTSLLILLLFFWGRSLRFRNLRWHIRAMLTAMAADILLVLALVFHRDALGQLDTGMHWTLRLHVPIAVLTVALYFPTAYAGYQLYRGHEPARPRLRRLDRWLVTFRVLNLVTSVMVQIFR